MADYLRLTLSEISDELDAVAREAQETFGGLDERRLNWKPGAEQWSVAQCFEHLLTANRAMLEAMDAAVDPVRPRRLVQRLPLLPGLFGPLLIKSQMPEATRKYKAPSSSTPSSSAIDGRVVERFAAQQRAAAAHIRSLDPRVASAVMVSPFVSFVVYSVLDSGRLMVTHNRRHFEQARRVMQQPGFAAG